jgi:hypothetical protein
MKTFLRTFAWLPLIVWLGGEFFFVITAWAAFHTLPYDQHAAGTIVGLCLRTLHREGLYAGAVIIVFTAIGFGARAFRASVLPAILVVLVMMGLTAYSQFSIIPRMDRDLAAAGGTIESLPATNPARIDFNRLHHRSVHVESGVMIAGLLVVVLLAHASGIEDRRL